jgi:hypothetical protein
MFFVIYNQYVYTYIKFTLILFSKLEGPATGQLDQYFPFFLAPRPNADYFFGMGVKVRVSLCEPSNSITRNKGMHSKITCQQFKARALSYVKTLPEVARAAY